MSNNFFRKPNFKYDDFWAADTIFEKEYYFFSIDFKSAYQHIVIDPKYYNYFGFSWKNDKQEGAFYRLRCLAVSLSTVPYTVPLKCVRF